MKFQKIYIYIVDYLHQHLCLYRQYPSETRIKSIFLFFLSLPPSICLKTSFVSNIYIYDDILYYKNMVTFSNGDTWLLKRNWYTTTNTTKQVEDVTTKQQNVYLQYGYYIG